MAKIYIKNVKFHFNFFNMVANKFHHSHYYLKDSFTTKVNDLDINFSCFSLFHYNVRSIPKNMQNFQNYLDTLNFRFSIMDFSETWFTDVNYKLSKQNLLR